MGNRKKKYEAGEASNFMTRKRALKKLQLTLKDFRRLCILKGVFPREPRNRKRAQKGNVSKVSTLYYEKDIRFLLHEPIVNKFRDFKVFLRKLKKAQEKKNWDTVDRLRDNKPKYTLDTIVKERYPTFIDALRDLEDCLCLCFLYSTFPKTQKTPVEMVSLCKRLTTEFMHFVIEARALKKVFCSIKGYYFQAEIKGQTVTWIVPHSFGFVQPASVDMRLMSIFVEFYTTVLGFVNFRLYHSLNLSYPPTLALSSDPAIEQEDRVMALNQALARTLVEPENEEMDQIVLDESDEAMEKARLESEARDRQTKLFSGLRFFLGREVPREPIVFMIRAVGGEVSWDATVAPGATYSCGDEKITHQISDRASVEDKVLGRFYVQPQWIFDSINRRERCGEADFALGETLPPHLSPFLAERRIGDYVPPEQRKLEEGEKAEEEEEEEDDEDEEEDEEENIEDDDSDEEEEKEEGAVKKGEESTMGVKVGTMTKLDEDHDRKMLEDEEYKLRVMMIKKKHRGLYRSMMKSRKKRMNEAKNMEKKRKDWDEKSVGDKKAKKKKIEEPSAELAA
jgi:pescadillo protein